MGKYTLDNHRYKALARQAVAEGCVLLKNDNEALPLRTNDKVAVFGRMAFHYYKSGLGSGGLVNARYVVGILDALRAEKNIKIDEKVLSVYEKWIEEHPYDEGEGWGKVPWSQEEMPVTEELKKAASENDAAIVIIGRTAGEDQDNQAIAGQYLLTDAEESLIAEACKRCKRTIVVLNVGNIIDMKWVKKYNPAAVLYAWQGGQEGGNGVCDVLTGRVSPSGKLTDTIAEDIADYPSTKDFGDTKKNFYQEDIYVGYRYFETFTKAKEKVLYPFGYGLSYTKFQITEKHLEIGTLDLEQERFATVSFCLKNIGDAEGAEVVQAYVRAPQGKLGKPERVLAGFTKSAVLKKGEEVALTINIPKHAVASFDDSGVTGHPHCFLLEQGNYEIFLGTDVRSAHKVGQIDLQEDEVIEELEEALAPREHYKRLRPVQGEESYEEVPLRTVGPNERVEKPNAISYTGDKGYRLSDVYEKKVSMDDFIAQLTETQLMELFRGEGMCSPKVTPGTGSAFGGLTEGLRHFGIPAACTTDGPSGLRMDIGTQAFSLPNGTSLGCTFDLQLVEDLYAMLGKELRQNRIDALLGPGLNIHRNPLNGRNFEYISEDPFLTGKIGTAIIKGLNVVGSTGTIKHFCCNNQETNRRGAEGIVSARALREIYLKGFEMAVKEGTARAVMTTYGPVNGVWTAGNYDLNTLVLRKEWGYEGIVMTDWWADGNYEDEPQSMSCRAPMVAAGNDLYMVTSDASDETQDDLRAAYQEGKITLGQLQRNAAHILQFILQSPAMLYEMGKIEKEELEECKKASEGGIDPNSLTYFCADEEGTIVIENQNWPASKGTEILFGITDILDGKDYHVVVTASSELDDLAQLSLSVYCDNIFRDTITFRGSNGGEVTQSCKLGNFFGKTHYIKLYLGATGLHIKEVRFEKM